MHMYPLPSRNGIETIYRQHQGTIYMASMILLAETIPPAAKEDCTAPDTVEQEQAPTADAKKVEEKRDSAKEHLSDEERRTNRVVANRNAARASHRRRVHRLAALQSRKKKLSQANHELKAQNKQLKFQAHELRHQLELLQTTDVVDGGVWGVSDLCVASHRRAQSLLQLGSSASSSSLQPPRSAISPGVHHQHSFAANGPTPTQASYLPLLNQPGRIQAPNEEQGELSLELRRELLLEQCVAHFRGLPPGGC